METHLVESDGVIYQVPMTYRDAPLPTTDQPALIATAEHSVLGTRYIYDAAAEPLYLAQLVRLVNGNGVSSPSLKRGVGPAEARGVRLAAQPLDSGQVHIELFRSPDPSSRPPRAANLAGLVVGTWHPDPDGDATATGCLAVVRHSPQTD